MADPHGVCSLPAMASVPLGPPHPQTWMIRLLSQDQCLAPTSGPWSTCKGTTLPLLCSESGQNHGGHCQRHSPLIRSSNASLGGVCLRSPRRWAQPQRESSMTSFRSHQRKKRTHPKGPDVSDPGQGGGE